MTEGNGQDKDPPDLNTIIKLMGMTGSDHDAEALSALRMATARLKKWGWTWDSILRGKIKILPDPFATNVTMPTVSQGRGAGSTHYSHRPPPAPPPPPRQYDNQTEITAYFDKCEFKEFHPTINQRLAAIQKTWKANGFLLYGDYDFLRTNANSRTKAKRR